MLSLQNALLGVLFLASAPADAFWRMTCGRIQTGRIDPIITPGGIAGHAHLISGPINFNTTSTFDNLQAAYCTSCGIQDDKSAYWTPQLYYRFRNGSYVDVPTGGTVVYYLSRGDGMDSLVAFPPGFRLLSGDAALRSYDTQTLTYKNARPIADRTSFACLDYDHPSPETPGFGRLTCPGGLRAQIHFQNCWDGVNLYKSDQSHTAYMSGIDTGSCPPTHPVYIPHLFYEVIYSVNSVAQEKGGYFVFSNGDTTGYGFHGDFLHGWDMGVLKSAIKQCMGSNATNGGGINTCPPLNASLDAFMDKNCPEQPNIVNEQARGLMKFLPGCNPPTGGPLRASQNVCPVQPNLLPVNNTDGIVRVRDVPGDKHGDFQYLGCAFDAGSPKTLQGGFFQAGSALTLESCFSYCRGKNYRYSGVENGYQCYCGNAFLQTVQGPDVCSTQSAIVCNGNSLQYCGGQNIVYLYNDTLSNVPVKGLPAVGQTKINVPSGGVATYGGCFPEPNGGRALLGTSGITFSFSNSSGMTNELCTQFCKAGGYSLAGTEFASECYCGNQIKTYPIGGGNCSSVCVGDSSEFCGQGGKLSVYSLATDGSVNVVAPNSPTNTASNPTDTGTGTPVSTASATGIVYAGCISEATNGRALKAFYQDLGATGTIDACANLAQAANYRYFGMEYTSQCSYGDFIDSTSRVLANTSCNLKCKGNPAQYCGAGNVISLYNNTLYTPRVAPVVYVPNQAGVSYLYKGCYSEGTTGRAIGATSTSAAYTLDTQSNSLETCAALCFSKGYSWMGTEYSSQCYCNNVGVINGAVLSPGGDADCGMACKGNGTENCGNAGKVQVYQLKAGTAGRVGSSRVQGSRRSLRI